MPKSFSIRTNNSGFTLVEIAIAVAILGLAFTTLIGLHTKMINTYGVEKNRNLAAMLGQYMFAMIEVSPTPPEVGTDSGNLRSKLQDYGYFKADNQKWKSEDFDDWEFTQTVVSEGLLDIPDVYRRIELKLSWGTGEDDSFDLVYFVFTKSYTASATRGLGAGGPGFGAGGGPSGGLGSNPGSASGSGISGNPGSSGFTPSPSQGYPGTNPSGFGNQFNPYQQLQDAGN